MKKILILGLILTLVMSLSVGCAKKPAEAKFTDGDFTAESDIDENGWKGVIEISVKDGVITTVNYDEVNEEGGLKSEDTEYSELMKSISNISPAEAYEVLEASLVDTQDVDKVEAVSGATGSAELFKELAKKALAK